MRAGTPKAPPAALSLTVAEQAFQERRALPGAFPATSGVPKNRAKAELSRGI